MAISKKVKLSRGERAYFDLLQSPIEEWGIETSEIDERGFDLFFGVGALFGEWRGFSALLEYDRYFLDGDGVDSLSIGILYGFGK